MPDDLRTRIAYAMYRHEHQASRSAWDGEDEHVHDYWRAAADAVIRELAIEVEDGECGYCQAQLPGCRYSSWANE